MAQTRRRSIILAIIVISLAFSICYIKLKYFLRPKEAIFIQKSETSTTSPQSSTDDNSEGATPPIPPPSAEGDVTIHIATSVSSNYFKAVPTLVNSLKHHHGSNRLVIHILTTDNSNKLKSLISCCKLDEGNDIEIDVREYVLPKEFSDLITVTGSTSIYGKLSSGSNFVRFFLSEIYPSLTHILYMDVDQVVHHDITGLWTEVTNGGQLITSTTIPNRSYGTYLKPLAKELYDKRHSKSLDLSTPCIIGGLFGVNLELWKKLDISQELMYWMKEHNEHHMWSLGSQPLLMLIGYGRMKIVDKRWNLTGLGWNTKYNPEELNNYYILHWNGKHKPWLKDGLYKEGWEHYTPEIYKTCLDENS